MNEKFLVRKISGNQVEKELCAIGFDASYLDIAKDKYKAGLFKISNVTPLQATILKQTALSCGTDCAVHRDVLTHSVEYSDVLLFATAAQLKEILNKLVHQPFGLKTLAQNLEAATQNVPSAFTIRNKVFNPEKTYIMGILNCTPNSFSDGGEFLEEKNAMQRFSDIITQGADIVDIGAESTAPFNDAIDIDEEISRLKDILKNCREQNPDIPISVDTRNAKTAQLALDLGADIINDVSGFVYDEKMAEVAASANVYAVLTFDDEISSNTIDETVKGLLKRVDIAINAGLSPEKIILDPGLGFRKTFEQNFEIIKRADEICSLGFPMLYGLSRKSFVQKVTGLKPKETLCANVSLASYLAQKGVRILRVHDVLEHKIAFSALDKVLYD